VRLAECKLKIEPMRLRQRRAGFGAGVLIPAYESLKCNGRTTAQMPGSLLNGVSTRNYAKVMPEMADSDGSARVMSIL